MQILITGGTGFVGTALARRLLGAGHRLRLLSRRGPRSDSPTGDGVEHVAGAIEDPAVLASAVSGCGAVFHLAAREDVPWLPRRDRSGEAMFAVNVLGTRAVLEAATRAGARTVVVTSCTTFGHAGDGIPNDGSRPHNVGRLDSVYVWSRLQQEVVCLEAAARGQPVVVVAPTVIVGPGDEKGSAAVIAAFLAGRLVVVPPGGYNFIAIEDVAAGLEAALHRGEPGRRYLFAHENLTYQEFLARVAAVTGRRAPRMVLPAGVIRGVRHAAEALAFFGLHASFRAVDKVLAERFFFDGRIAVEELGLPQTPIDGAIARTVESLARQPR